MIFQFNNKRRIIQDLYFLGSVSHKRELKDCTFFNFNVEIAVNIGVSTATSIDVINARTDQWLIVFIINHLTRYLKLFGTDTTGE